MAPTQLLAKPLDQRPNVRLMSPASTYASDPEVEMGILSPRLHALFAARRREKEPRYIHNRISEQHS
jgi:hypothetical protein